MWQARRISDNQAAINIDKRQGETNKTKRIDFEYRCAVLHHQGEQSIYRSTIYQAGITQRIGWIHTIFFPPATKHRLPKVQGYSFETLLLPLLIQHVFDEVSCVNETSHVDVSQSMALHTKMGASFDMFYPRAPTHASQCLHLNRKEP